MVKPDVIVCNPYGIDYPVWRAEMIKHENMFNRLIVTYYNDNRLYNFMPFIKEVLPNALHLDYGDVPGGKDWRNHCINPALKESHNEWILFIEQDFVTFGGFWEEVLEQAENYDIASFGDLGEWSENVRLHPAFILVRRSFIDKTSKDFGAYPERGRDHFATFTEELYRLKPRFLDLNKRTDWKHYAGLYSNMMLVQAGLKPNYRPTEFKEFMKRTLSELSVVQDPHLLSWAQDCVRAVE